MREGDRPVFRRLARMDIPLRVFALIFLLAALPVLLLIGMAIAGCGRKPLFLQPRVGRDHRIFRIIKFRTIDDAALASPDAWRLAAFSRLATFLRRTRLDEVPQLLNVVLGDMAFVGPRPLMPRDFAAMAAPRSRQAVKPGITGLAQLCGGDLLPLPQKLRLDLHYVENRSLILDVRIIAATLPGLVRGIDFEGPRAVTAIAEKIGAYSGTVEVPDEARTAIR